MPWLACSRTRRRAPGSAGPADSRRSLVPAEYDRIRAENVARYGWDTAVLELLGQLYSERTHFIFELIQNAEDARATALTFTLFPHRLEVRPHRPAFTSAHAPRIS